LAGGDDRAAGVGLAVGEPTGDGVGMNANGGTGDTAGNVGLGCGEAAGG
jgi:hypothetical protein